MSVEILSYMATLRLGIRQRARTCSRTQLQRLSILPYRTAPQKSHRSGEEAETASTWMSLGLKGKRGLKACDENLVGRGDAGVLLGNGDLYRLHARFLLGFRCKGEYVLVLHLLCYFLEKRLE